VSAAAGDLDDGNVFGHLAYRWGAERNDHEPIIKVFAELAPLDHLLQIAFYFNRVTFTSTDVLSPSRTVTCGLPGSAASRNRGSK
jgi:hypothetical protein